MNNALTLKDLIVFHLVWDLVFLPAAIMVLRKWFND